MNHQLVLVDVRREVMSLEEGEIEFAADVHGEPARDLDAPDVLADGVMCTAFGDEHLVARAQGLDLTRAFDEGGQVALEAGKENREGGHGHIRGGVTGHL